MISAEGVIDLYNTRVRDRGREMQVVREVQDLYQGDVVVPLPEFDIGERAAVVNVARANIDQMGMRIASEFPEISVPPGSMSKRSLNRARDRTRVLYGIHERERTQRKMRRRSRHLVGYASSPVSWSADFANERPRCTVRSPLSTYAAETGDPDVMVPPDCIFATAQTMGWLKIKHPEAFADLFDRSKGDTLSTAVEIIEYIDQGWVWLIAGRRAPSTYSATEEFSDPITVNAHKVLAGYPNRIERVPVSIPGQITLGPRVSPYSGIVGMFQAAAEMEALSRIATRKGILQEEWLIGYQGDEPELVQAADPFQGQVGIVKGGVLENRSVDPQFATGMAVDRLERGQRMNVGAHPELNGEAARNVRTGRRGDQLLGAVVDFPVQESHQLFEESLEYENECAALIDLKYFRNVPKVWAVKFGGEKGRVSYTPGELWERGDGSGDPALTNSVSYFMAGMDANDRIISIGQHLGIGTMSADTAMRKDPLVEDADHERAQMTAEELRRALLAQVQAMAADPQSGLATQDIAALIDKVKSGDDIEDAWLAVEQAAAKRAQEREAQQAQAPPQGIEGVAPEVPGQIRETPDGVGELNGLLLGLRGQAMTTSQG